MNTISIEALEEFFRAPRGDVPREGLQALEVALKHGASMRANATLTTRAIFLRTEDNKFRGRLGDGLEVRLLNRQTAGLEVSARENPLSMLHWGYFEKATFKSAVYA